MELFIFKTSSTNDLFLYLILAKRPRSNTNDLFLTICEFIQKQRESS